jgi:hypothetical protein
MKISQLVQFSLDETTKNPARAASQETGRNLARSMASGGLTPDQLQRSIQGQQSRLVKTPNTGDTLGQTTPQQRLAAQRQTNGVAPAAPGTQVVPANTQAAPQATNTQVAPQGPVNLGAATPDAGEERPGNDLATTQEPAAAPAEKGKLAKAGDWVKGKLSNASLQGASNLIQRGAANAKDNIPGIAGYASDLVGNTAQAVAPGANKAISAVGDVGTNLAQNASNVASAVGGGLTKTIGATLGGFGQGYHTARQGKSFRDAAGGLPGAPRLGGQYQGDPYQGGDTGNAGTPTSSGTDRPASGGIGGAMRQAAGVGGQGGGEGTDAISDLKNRLGRVEKAMGLAESKKPQGTMLPHVRRRAV